MTVIAIKDVDMAGYEPISTAKYPAEGTDLEMYSFIVNNDNVLDRRNYPLGKRTCTAGNFDAARAYGTSNCFISQTFAVLGSPIIDADSKHLVGLFSWQGNIGEDHVPTAFSVSVPIPEGHAVKTDDKIATTWSNIKKSVLHK